MPVEIYPEMRADGSIWEIKYDSDTGTYDEKNVQPGTGAGWDYSEVPSSESVGAQYGWDPTSWEAPLSVPPDIIDYGSQPDYSSVSSYMGPSQSDSLPFKMDDGSFVFWKNGILFGPYYDQNQSQQAYNSANGLANELGKTTTKTGTTATRSTSAPSVGNTTVDPALEYKKWAAEHALDVAREVMTMTKGDIDRARLAATGVISFYNDYAQTFGFSPNMNMEDLYQSLYGPQVDWKSIFGDWGLDVSGGGGGAPTSTGGTDTRSRSLEEARSELRSAGASAEDLTNDSWVRSEYTKLSGRQVL